MVLFAVFGSARTGDAHEVRPGAVVFTEVSDGIYSVDVHPGIDARQRTLRPTVQTPCIASGGLLDCREAGLRSVSAPELAEHELIFGVVVRPLSGQTSRHVLAPGESMLVLGAPPTALSTWLSIGAAHVAFGWDHLLFVTLLGWLLLLDEAGRRWGRAIRAVTGFTLGHSFTLGAVALGALSLPSEAVELSIALSIVWLAREVVLGRTPSAAITLFCFGSGLIHGCGFGGALLGIGLPTGEAALALLGFNLGVELAQLVVLAAVWGLHRAVSRTTMPDKVGLALGWSGGLVACGWCSVRATAYLEALL